MKSLFSKISGSIVSNKSRSRSDQKLIARATKMLEEGEDVSAFPLFSVLATKGDAEAQWQVGRAYLSGKAVPYSLADGAYWINLAAEQGFPSACLTLAHLYQEGLPASLDFSKKYQTLSAEPKGKRISDTEKARYWAEKAAEAGDINAQAFLGALLRKKTQTDQTADIEKSQASKWLQRSIEGGSVIGKLEYGRQLLEDEGYFKPAEEVTSSSAVTETFYKGINYLEEALEEGAIGAALLLGWLRLYGPEVFRDIKKAISLLESAAEKGFSQAEYRLGLLYMQNHHGFSADFVKAEKWLKLALKKEIGGGRLCVGTTL